MSDASHLTKLRVFETRRLPARSASYSRAMRRLLFCKKKKKQTSIANQSECCLQSLRNGPLLHHYFQSSACTNGCFGRFYAKKWLPYAKNLKLGRTLTSSKNRVRPSAIAVTYTSVLRICVFDLAAVSRKSRVRNGCDFGK